MNVSRKKAAVDPPVDYFPIAWLTALLAVVFVGLRPIAADDLWWELSRGREVCEGSISPSRELLAAETGREADWLGGAAWFLAYGCFGASGLMLLRLAAAGGYATIALRQSGHRARAALPLALSLLATNASFDPGPRLWDAIGVIAVLMAVGPLSRVDRGKHAAGWLVLFALWSNLGPGVALGLLVSACATTTDNNGWRVDRWLASFVGCCLNPRGVASLWDSLRTLAPPLAADAATLGDTAWRPLAVEPPPVEALAFVLLSLWTLVLLWRAESTRWRDVAAWAAAQSLAWISVYNLGAAAVWLGWLAMTHNPPIDTNQANDRRSVIRRAVVVLLAGIVFWQYQHLLGWGVHGRLDYRLTQLALQETRPHGTAWSADARGGGMLCWLNPPEVQLQDHPRRALLGGRLRDERRLADDLQSGRKGGYWRADGDRGGWWLELQQRRTTLLLIPAEDVLTLRSLEPTLWKPLSLDAAVLPLAAAGDPHYANRMVEALGQRDFAENQAWTYSPPPSTGGEFDRLRDMTEENALRQAGVFRAMRLHIAALRVLAVAAQRRPTPAIRAAWAACQRELAHQEALQCGRASEFRQAAASEPDADWAAAIEPYSRGDLPAACASLGFDAQQQYALGCLQWELGDVAAAAATFQRLRQGDDPEVRALAAWYLKRTEDQP